MRNQIHILIGKLQVYNIWLISTRDQIIGKLDSTGKPEKPGHILTENFNEESISYFNDTLQVYSIWLISWETNFEASWI